MPMEMVQAGELVDQLFWLLADHLRLSQHCPYRNVAQTDYFVPLAVADNCLCHHTAWIGKVYQPCIGTQFLHVLNNA